MENKTWHECKINGIPFVFIDEANSKTVPYVIGEFEKDFYRLKELNLKPTDCVIDVGTNVGIFSIYMKKVFGCKVICFEPIPSNIDSLKQNIWMNGFTEEDFEIHQCAISDVDGEIVRIGVPPDNTGGSSIEYGFVENAIECRTETLSKYLTPDCKYLKIDCEGAEYQIIPTIVDKLPQLNYLGIELHKYTEDQDPLALYNLINSNFSGLLACNDPKDPAW